MNGNSFASSPHSLNISCLILAAFAPLRLSHANNKLQESSPPHCNCLEEFAPVRLPVPTCGRHFELRTSSAGLLTPDSLGDAAASAQPSARILHKTPINIGLDGARPAASFAPGEWIVDLTVRRHLRALARPPWTNYLISRKEFNCPNCEGPGLQGRLAARDNFNDSSQQSSARA